MMKLLTAGICFYVVLLAYCSDDKSLLEGTCQNLDILMAQNASTGIQIILASTKTTNSSPVNITIADHYLPPECGVNHLCGVLHFEQNKTDGEISFYIIPSIGGFVMLAIIEEEPQNSFVGVTEECNPTRAFLAEDNHIIIACMDLQARPRLYYLNYNFLPNSTGSGSIVRATELPTRSEMIFNTTVSEIIHVRGQARCPQSDNLYIIDDAYILRFPVSDTFDPEFRMSGPLQNCVGYQSFEYYGNDILIIRCANNQTALYDSCTGHFTYPPPDRVPYPCTNWSSTIAYRNRQLTLNRDGEYAAQQLPFSDLSYGKCVQGVDHPTFIASSADGSIFIAPFDGSNFTKITSGNCSDNDMACPRRPVFSENEKVFGVLDSTTGSLVIVNLTEGCNNLIIASIPIPFMPSLTSISLGQGTYNCNCSLATVQTVEPPSTTQAPEATQVEPIAPTTRMEFTTMDAKQTESMTATIVGVPVSLFVVALLIIMIIIIIYLMVRSRRKSNKAAVSWHCGPGDSTGELGGITTTVYPETNEATNSTSSESEQTVPMRNVESGSGGGTNSLSSDFHPNDEMAGMDANGNDESIEPEQNDEQNEANTGNESEIATVRRESSSNDEASLDLKNERRRENVMNNFDTVEANNNGDHEENVNEINTLPINTTATQASMTNEPGNRTTAPIKPHSLSTLGVSDRYNLCTTCSTSSTTPHGEATVTPKPESGNGNSSSDIVPISRRAAVIPRRLIEQYLLDTVDSPRYVPDSQTEYTDESQALDNDNQTEHNDESQMPDNDTDLQ